MDHRKFFSKLIPCVPSTGEYVLGWRRQHEDRVHIVLDLCRERPLVSRTVLKNEEHISRSHPIMVPNVTNLKILSHVIIKNVSTVTWKTRYLYFRIIQPLLF